MDEEAVKKLIGPSLLNLERSEAVILSGSIICFAQKSVELISDPTVAQGAVMISVPPGAKGFVVHRFLFGVAGWTAIPGRTVELCRLIAVRDVSSHDAACTVAAAMTQDLLADVEEWQARRAAYDEAIRDFNRLFA